jgi:hypothetical protein
MRASANRNNPHVRVAPNAGIQRGKQIVRYGPIGEIASAKCK